MMVWILLLYGYLLQFWLSIFSKVRVVEEIFFFVIKVKYCNLWGVVRMISSMFMDYLQYNEEIKIQDFVSILFKMVVDYVSYVEYQKYDFVEIECR